MHEYYEPLIRRWLKALETEGYVVKNDKNQYRIKKEITRDLAEHSWEQWLKVDSKVHYNDLMMNFFGETRTNLLPLLRGKLDPIDLFFPKGSFKVALAAYKDNIVSKCTNRVVVEDMLVLVKHFTKKYPQKQFRILEIGAGVGGVSIDLIEALKIYNVEYLFTDISRSFLNEAQERFKKYPWVKFGLYDINIDYWKQDIPTSYFDVILCNNVLHNANNEVKVLLMERAFGMIIGADTYKVGHTVEDELLKRAIKELGEKYGDNVSNEELVSLEGEFLPVSQCYGKLIKKTHAERLLELYNTLPATKGETSGYSKERLDTLYKVFCHSFSAVIMYDAGIYVGNALVLSCRNKNSSFLPVEPTDNERFWKEATVGNITSELIEGEHLTCMTGSYADKVAERILKEERL